MKQIELSATRPPWAALPWVAVLLTTACGVSVLGVIGRRNCLTTQLSWDTGLLYLPLFVVLLAAGYICWRVYFPGTVYGSGREFTQIVESLASMVIVRNAEGEVQYVNRRVLEYLGKELADPAGLRWIDAVHPGDRASVLNEWNRRIEPGSVTENVFRLRRFDGAYRWFEMRVQPLLNERGQTLHWYGQFHDIDDRKQAEAAFEAQEQQLRSMADTIPAFVWRATPDGKVNYKNERFLQFIGASHEEVTDDRWMMFLHPGEKEEVARGWSDSWMNGTSYRSVNRLRRADGVYRWFDVRGEPLRDSQGKVLAWYGVLFDIDDRKKAEDAVAKSEQQLRLLTETIPAYVWRAAPDGKLDYQNRPLREFVGLSQDELTGEQWLKCIHPDDIEETQQAWQKSWRTGTPFRILHRGRGSDGVYRWFDNRGDPLCDENGKVLSWYGVILDIDDRKRAEDAVRESENHLRQIADTIPAIVWRTTPEGRIEYVNRRGMTYSGESWNAFASLIHPDDKEATLRRWLHSVQTGDPYENRFRLRRCLDGVYRWFHVRGEPLRDPAGRIVYWYKLLVDIDDDRKVAEELRHTQSILSRATQLATISELSATIAHEINQPLAAVVANGEACRGWLLNNPPNLERARLTAERVIRDGNSAAAVVRRVRELFKQAKPAKELLDINEVLREAAGMMADETRSRNIDLKLDLDRDLPLLLLDRVQIQQVVVNLMSNAIESMEGLSKDRKGLLLVSGREDADGVVVKVRDQGSGITDPDSIFDAFFTTKKHGMGIGLAICRTIVEAHGGRIWATPNVGHGTALTFTFPTQTDAPG